METLLKTAPIEDVIGATELVYEHDTSGAFPINAFGLDNTLSFVNFGCIKATDKVITIASHLEMITWSIAYLYTPLELVAGTVHTDCKAHQQKWEVIHQLLSGYQYTAPVFSDLDINGLEDDEELFDVAITGYAAANNSSSIEDCSRFHLETGIEYEMFEKLLKKSSSLLKKNGILVILAKPGWILKVWQLIDTLGLQLEYDHYRLYTECNKHPNTFIWLRFVKKTDDVDGKLHQKNVLSLMADNGIDRLYAHRNQLRFPYVELSYDNSESYVKLNQNLEYLQYFFSAETTANLAKLCDGYTACLVTPSIAQYAYQIGKNLVLFERDNRFRENGGLKFVKYDLNTGLTKFLQNRYVKKFDRVICDPPFDIKLDALAKDIVELLKQAENSVAYVVFPDSRRASLINAMKNKGLSLCEESDKINIEYAKPPKIVRIHGKDAIQLYKFVYDVK